MAVVQAYRTREPVPTLIPPLAATLAMAQAQAKRSLTTLLVCLVLVLRQALPPLRALTLALDPTAPAVKPPPMWPHMATQEQVPMSSLPATPATTALTPQTQTLPAVTVITMAMVLALPPILAPLILPPLGQQVEVQVPVLVQPMMLALAVLSQDQARPLLATLLRTPAHMHTVAALQTWVALLTGRLPPATLRLAIPTLARDLLTLVSATGCFVCWVVFGILHANAGKVCKCG